MKRTVYLDPAFKKKKPKKKVEPPKEGSDLQAPPVQPPKPRLSIRFKSRIGAPPPPLEVKLRASTQYKTNVSATQRQFEKEMEEAVVECAYPHG